MSAKYTTVSRSNPEIQKLRRKGKEDNVEWIGRAITELVDKKNTDQSYVLLLGATDTLGWRLRIGQSHLRFDMLPSYWSTSAFLKVSPKGIAQSSILHVPLFQPETGMFASERNGVVETPLQHLEDPDHWKNIAVIALPKSQKEVLSKLDQFEKGRAYVDALEHVLRWLAFSWGVARTPNPIHDGIGLPSACMLETLYASAGLDLTPGLETRASSPEAIWATAMFWYDYYTKNNVQPPKGRYWTPHEYKIEDGK
ncbi:MULTISPECIES: hypothetical protein [unclassified Pseudomonas]|jgi:hypothetical protein|uniref:hypothetical protein n=1 Tax=unclassified Pseudomonas TaxID=196821 RepID=UPI00215F90CB|nr:MULTISPECIES: hypothetical protein [unclassified Pseudomonas]UVM48050.1 hypothetical protein LOY38_16615 [Pseudomonas sp. B21-015]WPN55752.1 hypothetical protein QMK51_16345 [Pseudomonas sp. P9_31]